MANASHDDNHVPSLLGVSSVDGVTPVTVYADPTSHRLLVSSSGGGSGTVTGVLVASANGLAGTSDNNPTTPTLTLSTTVTGILEGNGTAISAATTDGTGNVVLDTGAVLTSPTITTGITPTTNDGAAIGSSTLSFSDVFLASGGTLNWNNGTVIATQTGVQVAFTGSGGASIGIVSVSNTTGALAITGATSGTAIIANTISTGTGFSMTGLTSGTGINITGTTTGRGYVYNTTGATATTSGAMSVTGTATMTADYTGAFVLINPVRTMTAVATRIHSGQMLNISPTYSITGTSASVYTLSGATALVTRTLTNSSSSASSGLTVTGDVLALSNTLGTATNAVTDSSHVLSINQSYTSATGSALFVKSTAASALVMDIQNASTSVLSASQTEVIANVPVRLKGYTVATLPIGTQGDTAFVTDALAPTFLATIVGGGTVVTPVFYNGANWVGY